MKTDRSPETPEHNAIRREERAVRILDLLSVVRRHDRFEERALAICNELAVRYGCRQVSVGWLQGRYVRLRGVNEKARILRKVERVQEMESAMEEALELDDDIVIPNLHGQQQAFEHNALARSLGTPFLCSIILRAKDVAKGVILLQKEETPFSESDCISLHLAAINLAPLLEDSWERDQWAGKRLARSLSAFMRRRFDIEHFWTTAAALTVSLAIFLLFVIRIDYSINCPFILRPVEQAAVVAPRDGFLKSVLAKTGDHVDENTLLASLDKSELSVRQAFLEAQLEQQTRLVSDARQRQAVTELGLAEARKKQANASLKEIRHLIKRSYIHTPISGVVIEDQELNLRIGSPVKQGDPLFTVADLETLLAEIQISENNIHGVPDKATGVLVFLSEPDEKFPFSNLAIEPRSKPSESGNVFKAHAQFKSGNQDWWRPGMSGSARIKIGERSLFWILTHRFQEWISYHFLW